MNVWSRPHCHASGHKIGCLSSAAVERHADSEDLRSLRKSRAAQARSLSLRTPEQLLERFTAEYVFALLTRCAFESPAREDAARFSAMEAARENVAKQLDDLRQMARQARQSEITTELLVRWPAGWPV